MFRVALVGCGKMAQTWADYASKRTDVRVKALVDVNRDNAIAFNRKFGMQASVYQDHTTALEENRIDVVLNVTPPEYHFAITMDALNRGCHVFSEKPMAHTLEQCTKLAEQARKSDRVFAIMQNRRYLASIRSCAAMVSSGLIGKLGFTCVDYFMGRANMGGHYQAMASPLLLDMAIHTFDEARLLSGSNATSVVAYEFSHPGTDFLGNDSAVCLFEMEDGSVFSYRGCWSAPGANTPSQGGWRITGDNGTIIWDGKSYPYAELRGPIEEGFISVLRRVDGDMVYAGQESYSGCLDAMFASVIEGRKPETSCSDNLNSMKMVFAAVKSARTGEKVYL